MTASAAESTGPSPLDTAMLRIFTATGTAAGLGFLVADQIALTCAHVVTGALGIKDGGQSPLGATVEIDLPLLNTGGVRTTATVVQWAPAQLSGSGDVAVLSLGAPLPGARPVRLVEADQVWGHAARVYGLPHGHPGGVWHSCTLRHRQANGWVQADLAGLGYRVSPGFSGSPVWDDDLAGVVGMMAFAESGSTPVSYLLPTSDLLAAWPGLRELVLPPSPFRGLRPFRESDSALFRGRQDDSDQVSRIVAGHRWTTLVGPSGCGKSSLAMAGVVPQRRAAGDCPVIMRPARYASPLGALAAALLPQLEPELSETQRIAETAALEGLLAEQGLHATVARILELQRAERLLVVIDQFEELLDVAPDAVAELMRVLLDAPASVRVLCTLRADFLEPVLAHPRLGPVVSERVCALEPMRPEQLREIVTAPVADVPGVGYQPNLAERILTDTGTQPGALPLLGLTLDLLWERQERGLLTHDSYEQIGGVAGALGSYAERAWAENISAADEQAAMRLLTQLVRVPIGANAPTRRIAPRAELGEQEWRVAQRLAATRLLVLNGGDGPETVELAHEALIQGWDRLARQISDDRAFLDWRESLRHDLDRWERGGRSTDQLPTATALVIARQWLPEHATDLSEAERDYLERGRLHHHVQTRNRRALQSVLAILLVAALVFGTLYTYASQRSAENQAIATSQALAQASQDTTKSDPALAVMAALAAYQTSPTSEARNQLLRQYLAHRYSSRVFSGMPGEIQTFDTSQDGGVVYAATDMGRSMLFVQSAAGTVRSVPIPAEAVVYAKVTPDGKRVGFVDDSGNGGWFDVDRAAAQPAGPVHRLPRIESTRFFYSDSQDAAALSADGKLMAVPAEGKLVWWDLEAGTIAGSVPAPPQAGNGLWFSPDNRSLLVDIYDFNSSVSGLVAVDMATGQPRTVLAPEPDQYYMVSGDRTAVAACNSETEVLQRRRIADGVATGRPYHAVSCDPQATDVTGRWIVVSDSLVDLEQGVEVSPITDAPKAATEGVDLISAAGKLYLASAGTASITYTELPTGPNVLDVDEQVLTSDGSRTISLLTNGALQLRPSGKDSAQVLAEVPAAPSDEDRPDGHLLLDRNRSLVAHREAADVVTVRETATLRQTARITAVMPPDPPETDLGSFLHTGRERPDLTFTYSFDHAGNLMTVSGTVVQQWDARTGRELARFDAAALVPPGDDSNRPAAERLLVGPYPGPSQVYVIISGDPVVRVVDLTTGRQVTTLETAPDVTSLQFEPSGRYLAVLRQGAVVELWRRDPLRRELGPLRSLTGISQLPWYASFLDDGRYVIAANNAIRVYDIDDGTIADSYEFGEAATDTLYQSGSNYFLHMSTDGRTVLHAGPDGLGSPLRLDPAEWQRELCGIIGHRGFTPDELASFPGSVPPQQVCTT